MTSTTTSSALSASFPACVMARVTAPENRSVLGGAALVAIAAALALIALVHVPLGDALAAFADGAWGSPYAIGASINRSLVFALVGSGFVLANRAQLTNVGGEGQIAMGGIVATAVSLYGHVAHLPLGLSVHSADAGRRTRGRRLGRDSRLAESARRHQRSDQHAAADVHRRVVSLLVRAIGSAAASADEQRRHAARIARDSRRDQTADALRRQVRPACISACRSPSCCASRVALVLAYSRFGMYLRAVGLNALAARRAGMPITSTIVGAMALAGALGGLAGALMLQGDQYSLKAGFSSGYGFDGLVVGLLARGSMTGVCAAALLFGFLRSGGINMEMVASVPSALVLIVQGIVIVALAGGSLWLEPKGAR